MKYIIFLIIALIALAYFGVIKINPDKASALAKQGVQKSVQLTEKGLKTLATEVDKQTQAADATTPASN
jgi:uncharacterized membrane protein (Fun14 family)